MHRIPTDTVYIVLIRDGDKPWGLLNIVDPEDFKGDFDKVQRECLCLITSWNSVYNRGEQIVYGSCNRSECSHCSEHPTWNSFEQAA